MFQYLLFRFNSYSPGVLLGIIFACGCSSGMKEKSTEQTAVDSSSLPASHTLSESKTVNAYITGTAGYPSESLPGDLTVYAERTDTKYTYSTNTINPGNTYLLPVTPGEYHVYAMTAEVKDYRAYYNEFVKCGMHVNCKSHKVIQVTVAAGDTVKGIDPQDWYDTTR